MAKKDKTSKLPDETEQQYMSRLNRDGSYRRNALTNAIARAGQDGGIEGGIDVLGLADVYYNWLVGNEDVSEGPILEKARKNEA